MSSNEARRAIEQNPAFAATGNMAFLDAMVQWLAWEDGSPSMAKPCSPRAEPVYASCTTFKS